MISFSILFSYVLFYLEYRGIITDWLLVSIHDTEWIRLLNRLLSSLHYRLLWLLHLRHELTIIIILKLLFLWSTTKRETERNQKDVVRKRIWFCNINLIRTDNGCIRWRRLRQSEVRHPKRKIYCYTLWTKQIYLCLYTWFKARWINKDCFICSSVFDFIQRKKESLLFFLFLEMN